MPDTLSHEVIFKAKRGDASAVAAIYRRYHNDVYRYLYYRVSDQHSAEDLTSEVFLRMLAALPNFQPRSVPFQAWLYRIARNLAIDHSRRNGRYKQEVLSENLADVKNDPAEAVETQLTAEELKTALSKLNKEQHDVIVLRFVNGLPISDTALVVEKSQDAVKGLQRRGLLNLRTILDRVEVFYVPDQ